jgi:uncharacterized membrane protein HdeD (DUF308 family)
MNLATLARDAWMIAVRGGLAIAFGLSVLLWPEITLSLVVILFGIYAVLDGAWTISAGLRAAAGRRGAWPVVLEGVVSLGLGTLAIARPFAAGRFVVLLAGWGLATGLLELLAALYLPRQGAGHWLLATGGLSSLFLAALILFVARADLVPYAWIIAAWGLVFGTVMLLAAIHFRRGVRRDAYARTGG